MLRGRPLPSSAAAEILRNVRQIFDGQLHSHWFSIGLRLVSADLTSSR